MKKILKITGIIVLLITLWILKLVYDAGTFKTIAPHFAGKIQAIHNLQGVEDMTIDQETGLAFLSSDDRWAASLRHTPTQGAIYLLNLNDSLPKPLNLTAQFNEEFHPHGISLFKDSDGQRYLFAINHRKLGNFVEIFHFQGDSVLVHSESISDATWMVSPNDLLAVGKRQFYFTNDHGTRPSFWRNMGDYIRLKTGYVAYFDGKSYTKQSDAIQYANGVNMSNDGKTVFVASSAERKIYVFDREINTGKLSQTDVMDLGTGVDNIEVAKDGSLWLGCHPKLLAFTKHATHPKSLSPSQVLKVIYKGKGDFGKEEIYLNDGTEISGSSTGAVFGKKLLIGPVFQDRILYCEMQ